MIIRSQSDLQNIIKGGQITKKVLNKALSVIKPGITTMQIEDTVVNELKANNAQASFKGVNAGEGPYPYSCCVSVNHQLVHTLPSDAVVIKSGDLVTVDLGVKYKGLHTDTAYTVEVETKKQEYFLSVGKKALKQAVKTAVAGVKIGDISAIFQKIVEDAGFNVSIDLVGHGIGHKLHEPPQVPCFGQKGRGETLQENMLVAFEIMYMQGEPYLALGDDGFSFDTKDKSLSAQFENTILVQKNKEPLIII